jgi:zinc transporter ZupT
LSLKRSDKYWTLPSKPKMSSEGDATIGPTQDIPGYPGLTPIGLAFVLCFIGSFCNGIGAMLPFVLKNATNYKVLSFMLAMSAGMLGYLSFVELFAEAREFFGNFSDLPLLYTSLSFLSGGVLCIGLEYLSHFLVHKYGNGDEGVDLLAVNPSYDEENQNASEKTEQRVSMDMDKHDSVRRDRRKLKKISWFSLITISVHNIPEGNSH